MTRADLEPLRQCYHRATARELLVRARGFELDPQRRLQPRIDARILSFGSARTLYHQRDIRCRSLDALRSLSDPVRDCAQCNLRTRCTPQLRLDLIVERQAWRLLLERSSAKHFLDYHARLHRRAIALEDIVHHIAVIDRASWGELRFSDAPQP
jgi:hypothetical protein